jgi:DNA-binding MarR family transcriptional regulator
MRKAARRLSALYDQSIAETGLKSTQFAILAELATGAEAPTMAELAAALVMDRSALGHNLRPLEREGLVTWSEGETDRRRKHVALTTAGKAKLREALKGWKRAQQRFEAVFGAEEAALLRSTLLRIAHDDRLAALDD